MDLWIVIAGSTGGLDDGDGANLQLTSGGTTDDGHECVHGGFDHLSREARMLLKVMAQLLWDGHDHMTVINSREQQRFHLANPVNRVRGPTPEAKAALATEGDDLLVATMWADKLSITILRIATAEHLLDCRARALILWIETKKFPKPIVKDQFKGLKCRARELNHAESLADFPV